MAEEKVYGIEDQSIDGIETEEQREKEKTQ